MEFNDWLKAKGFDHADLSDVQRTALAGAWRAEQQPENPPNPDPPPPPPTPTPKPSGTQQTMADVLAARREEEEYEKRVTARLTSAMETRELTADAADVISKAAFAAKPRWDESRLELEIERGRRPLPGWNRDTRTAVHPDEVVEAAVCIQGGLDNLDRHFDERTLHAAHKHWKNGLSLGEVVLTYAKRGGYDGLNIKANLPGALRAAFQPQIRAAGSWGPSTGGGLSGVLSNVANKFLRAGFDSVEAVWRQIAAIRSVNDFKAITSYSLTGGLTYDKVPPGGEIKHGTLGAESYSNQVDTYGKMIGIDRRDLINDDLGALTTVGRRLGRGGALKINDIFWTVFLNNSSFFTSGRNNVSTGAGSALGVAGLDAANAKFLTQTDPDGNPLGVMPKILLVPPALWSTGAQLMQSTGLNQTPASNAAAGNLNIWASMFRLYSSAYMQNSNYTGNSSAAWYLLADPNDMATIEVAFLNGQEAPTVETADADFGMLGIALRGYHDFGAAFQEYRAGVRSAGS